MRSRPAAIAVLFVSVFASPANARCQSDAGRPSVGIAMGVAAFDGRFTYQLVPTLPDQEVLANAGHGPRFEAGFGVTRRWGLRVERASYTHGVERRTYGPHGRRARTIEFLDDMQTRELLFGVSRQRSPEGSRACVYSSVLVGTYRYSYKGVASRARGVAATIGVGGRAKARRPFGELRLGIAHNDSRPPLNAYASISLGASAGLRYRW